MFTKKEIMSALEEVMDPELNKSLVELDMVREVGIDGGKIKVTIALTTGGCPLKKKIEDDVRQRLVQIPGVEEVNIELGVMTEAEKKALAAKLGHKQSQPDSPLLSTDSPTQVIAIASGKGGVGKSTITANLAYALARQGLNVGILDCDIYGFSIPSILGVQEKPVPPAPGKNFIKPVTTHGIKVMSIGFFVPEDQPVIWRGPMLGKALRQFFRDVEWGDLDYLLLDLPPGTGDVALDIHNLLPRTKEIIVTTPQATAAKVATRAGRMAQKTDHQVLGVVENMSYLRCGHCDGKVYPFGKHGGAILARQLEVPLLAQIPLGEPTPEEGSLYETDSEPGKILAALAKKLVELAPVKKFVKSLYWCKPV